MNMEKDNNNNEVTIEGELSPNPKKKWWESIPILNMLLRYKSIAEEKAENE